ncbi:MAG: CsoR family transcriptional regulator [Candidatus Cloacimonetes bacterium HGW-Cloacimonetes-1]|jgi:DNA-binding FrmR family transcriptional regulator|nr:MAG: CsoR family transcriptional regulator [Candidatus Cloacimonetes bacterium HGW-Cloacimonetes-1]
MDKCCNSDRHAKHSEELKAKMINRINRIEGQVRGVKKMLEQNVYCDDIITQISAAKSALNSLSQVLFEAHLNSCIVEQIRSESPDIMEELQQTIRKMLKN